METGEEQTLKQVLRRSSYVLVNYDTEEVDVSRSFSEWYLANKYAPDGWEPATAEEALKLLASSGEIPFGRWPTKSA